MVYNLFAGLTTYLSRGEIIQLHPVAAGHPSGVPFPKIKRLSEPTYLLPVGTFESIVFRTSRKWWDMLLLSWKAKKNTVNHTVLAWLSLQKTPKGGGIEHLPAKSGARGAPTFSVKKDAGAVSFTHPKHSHFEPPKWRWMEDDFPFQV